MRKHSEIIVQQIQTLEEILLTTDSLPDHGALFLRSGKELLPSSPAIVLEVDPYVSDIVPDFAIANGFQRVLKVHQLQDIVANAQLQNANANSMMFVNALTFHLQSDAFIDFSSTSSASNNHNPLKPIQH